MARPGPLQRPRWPALAIAWAVVVWALLLLPAPRLPPLADGWGLLRGAGDELVHGGAFAVLGWLVARALAAAGRRHVAGSTLLVLGAYGVATELSQLLVPTRSCEASDLVADVLGGALGCWLAGRQTVVSGRAAGGTGGATLDR